MPDPSTELEELRRRVEEQSHRIDELQDALHTLSVAVQYRQEEPYLAFLAEHGIAGRRRLALNGVINGVLSRARGEVLSLGQGACTELAEDYPALAEAYLPEPIAATRPSASSARCWVVNISASRHSRPTAPAAWGVRATRHSPAAQTSHPETRSRVAPNGRTVRRRCSRISDTSEPRRRSRRAGAVQ